ncbi:MAG TPA: metalloregulator ArsR/SmtB family transcription factor [Roseiflexaceae bacterium]|nr:metalloregulator ArsR/SmtB family transcription factor [Roseiflexaceae bacterium]
MEPTSPLSGKRVERREVDLIARVFAGVSDPNRLRILLLLLESEQNVSELVAQTGISQGRVSIHLQCLRWCGFVESERRGKYVYYCVRDERVRALIAQALNFAASYHQQLASCTLLANEAQYSENEAR